MVVILAFMVLLGGCSNNSLSQDKGTPQPSQTTQPPQTSKTTKRTIDASFEVINKTSDELLASAATVKKGDTYLEICSKMGKEGTFLPGGSIRYEWDLKSDQYLRVWLRAPSMDSVFPYEYTVNDMEIQKEIYGAAGPLIEKPVEIEDNFISFPTPITTLNVYQVKNNGGDISHSGKTIEYSLKGKESERLKTIVAAFQTIELGTPTNVFQQDNIDYIDFTFCSEHNADTSDNCYRFIKLLKADEVYYFYINNNFYAIEDSMIEYLYSQIIFGIE